MVFRLPSGLIGSESCPYLLTPPRRLEKKASLDALKDFKDAEESFEKHLRTVLAPSDEESFLGKLNSRLLLGDGPDSSRWSLGGSCIPSDLHGDTGAQCLTACSRRATRAEPLLSPAGERALSPDHGRRQCPRHRHCPGPGDACASSFSTSASSLGAFSLPHLRLLPRPLRLSLFRVPLSSAPIRKRAHGGGTVPSWVAQSVAMDHWLL